MTNLHFPIFDKNFCARVDKKDKNLIRRPLLTSKKTVRENKMYMIFDKNLCACVEKKTKI